MLSSSTLKNASSRALSQAAGTRAYTVAGSLAPKKLGESSKQQHEPFRVGRRAASCCKASYLQSWPSRRSLGRAYSTSTRSKSTPPKSTSNNESIFASSDPLWDHVFEDIDDIPPLIPASVRLSYTSKTKVPLARMPRRLTMTAREISTFDEMFDMIFAVVEQQKQARTTDTKPRSLVPSVGIGHARSQISDLFGRLRRQSRRLKWTSEADEELDRKKEEMELCDTDQQLLEWAMREVFGESQRYEEDARRALEDPTKAEGPILLQPQAYPHLLSLLMRTFRERYSDPYLALSIFDHARHLSIPSFVFGCTTPTYNELIETRWRCFRDLRGVCDALEEMRINGVEMDSRTCSLAEMIRREVGERNMWQEESTLGSGEVWEMIGRIERLTAKELPKTYARDRAPKAGQGRKARNVAQQWKKRALKDNDPEDEWIFGEWDIPKEKPSLEAF